MGFIFEKVVKKVGFPEKAWGVDREEHGISLRENKSMSEILKNKL